MKMAIPIGPLVGKMMGFPPNLCLELIRTSDGVTYWATRTTRRARTLGYSPRDLGGPGFARLLSG